MVSLFIFILVLQCVSQERLPTPTVEEFTSMALWVLCDIELLKLVFGKRYLSLAKSDHKRGGITFEAAKANNFRTDTDNDGSIDSPAI